ncbi:MAG: peptidase domain-containing ABC transporter [Flavobacteriales bacterium]
MNKFPFINQMDQKDCGPTCLRMIAKYYKRNISIEKLRLLSETTREGSSLKNMSDTAEHVGFRTLGIKVSFDKFKEDGVFPCIVYWNQSHFVVVYKIAKDKVFIADPAHGLVTLNVSQFLNSWIGENANRNSDKGIALLLEPTPKLDELEEDDNKEIGFGFVKHYFLQYKSFIIQLAFGLLASSLLQLIFPFLTQSVVDVGIQNQDINFIYLILLAQLFLFAGRTAIELIRGWIFLHLSTRINISMVSDFFIKLMKLPIAFFDSKMTGDIMQRIHDHQKIKSLLTSSSLSVLFSTFNLIVFGFILAWYSLKIFTVFLIGSLVYFIWIALFLKKRKDLDYKSFNVMSSEQSKVIELISGMQDIKLHNAEKQKRWSWEYIQARLYKISIKNLVLEQWQNTGTSFINEVKNILISILSAKLVIDGELTLGMMLSISYIVGQLNAPIGQIMAFVHSLQDAKIALERLSEIHNKEDESENVINEISELPANFDIKLKNVSFRYKGSNQFVLDDVSLEIPSNKMTAIVGASGSGKTTLMKMLLKFYNPTNGEIKVGFTPLDLVKHSYWRSLTGVVMQEGFIFNDTIANNIAIGHDILDKIRLKNAVEIANIEDFIDSLPLGYNTEIGQEGVGLSGGQKQRILIARAIYQSPKVLFFDEATSSLDAKNEREIMMKLNDFLQEKTSIVIAHRLSTVKNADQIIVLDQGKIIEKGTHVELVSKKGTYFNLVKNQLELDRLNGE